METYIKKIIKGTIHSLGYNIARRKQIVPHVANYKRFDRPFYIEFIGPSGVGKTTLFNEVIKERKENFNWITPEEFISVENPAINDEDIFSALEEEIIETKTKIILDRNHSPSDKMKLLAFFYQNIRKIAMVKNFNKNYIVVFEDGLFHNFGDVLMNFYEKQAHQFVSMIANTAIIYCSNEPEIIARQILKRRDTLSILHPHHKYSTFGELENYQKKYIDELEKRITIFRQHSIRVFNINTADDLTKNAIKINEIINSTFEWQH